ncbi:unnamed protein product, partial [Rotaria magnacalcarata]
MTCKIFTEWLQDLDLIMRKQKRHILLFLDNAPVHPPDVQLENIKLDFFPPNTTAKIQPIDQGVIRAFKAYYRRHLVKHIIASADVAVTPSIIDGIDALQQISITDEIISAEDRSIKELDGVLRHLTIGGKPISGYDYV